MIIEVLDNDQQDGVRPGFHVGRNEVAELKLAALDWK